MAQLNTKSVIPSTFLKCESVYLSCHMTGNHCFFFYLCTINTTTIIISSSNIRVICYKSKSQQKVGQGLLKPQIILAQNQVIIFFLFIHSWIRRRHITREMAVSKMMSVEYPLRIYFRDFLKRVSQYDPVLNTFLLFVLF